jgi:hypothetical protein
MLARLQTWMHATRCLGWCAVYRSAMTIQAPWNAERALFRVPFLARSERQILRVPFQARSERQILRVPFQARSERQIRCVPFLARSERQILRVPFQARSPGVPFRVPSCLAESFVFFRALFFGSDVLPSSGARDR